MQFPELACSSFLCLSSSQEFRSACYYMMKMMFGLYYIAKEKIRKTLTESDHEDTEKGKDLKMKHGEIKLSNFGLVFEFTGFVAFFLSWTGMCLYSILGIVGVILITSN